MTTKTKKRTKTRVQDLEQIIKIKKKLSKLTKQKTIFSQSVLRKHTTEKTITNNGRIGIVPGPSILNERYKMLLRNKIGQYSKSITKF